MSLVSKTDTELVKLTLSRNSDAFAVLYERYVPMVERLILRTVGDTSQNQDIMQEVFIEAYLSLKRLKKPESFASWLYGITLNVCRLVLKNKAQEKISFEEIAGGQLLNVIYPGDVYRDPSDILHDMEIQRRVLHAIETLSFRLRQTVLLYYFEHLSLSEIAAALSVNHGVIKTRLYRARQILRRFLSPVFKEPIAKAIKREEKGMVEVEVLDVIGQTQLLLIDYEKMQVLSIFMSKKQVAQITVSIQKLEAPNR